MKSPSNTSVIKPLNFLCNSMPIFAKLKIDNLNIKRGIAVFIKINFEECFEKIYMKYSYMPPHHDWNGLYLKTTRFQVPIRVE